MIRCWIGDWRSCWIWPAAEVRRAEKATADHFALGVDGERLAALRTPSLAAETAQIILARATYADAHVGPNGIDEQPHHKRDRYENQGQEHHANKQLEHTQILARAAYNPSVNVFAQINKLAR